MNPIAIICDITSLCIVLTVAWAAFMRREGR